MGILTTGTTNTATWSKPTSATSEGTTLRVYGSLLERGYIYAIQVENTSAVVTDDTKEGEADSTRLLRRYLADDVVSAPVAGTATTEKKDIDIVGKD